MGNAILAKEWLLFGYKNLDTAKKLFDLDHYTDIIGAELQQGVEKILKSVMAYHNQKIKKSHNLEEIAALLDGYIEFDELELDMLEKMTLYYKVDRYPNPSYELPSKDEIDEAIKYGYELFDKVCDMLSIDRRDFNVR